MYLCCRYLHLTMLPRLPGPRQLSQVKAEMMGTSSASQSKCHTSRSPLLTPEPPSVPQLSCLFCLGAALLSTALLGSITQVERVCYLR